MLYVYSIFDRAAQAYGNPVCVPHSGIIIRSFTDECNNPESNFFKHPEDYELYHIGTFNPDTGLLESVSDPALILQAQQVKVTQPK